MDQTIGVLIAIVSSCLGGTAAAVTRYLVGNADPITLAILRWGIGFLCVLPVALCCACEISAARRLAGRAVARPCFSSVCSSSSTTSRVGYTTAARASLALSTLPLQTMVVGALLGIEPLTLRKSLGVGIAMLGVFAALATGPCRRRPPAPGAAS